MNDNVKRNENEKNKNEGGKENEHGTEPVPGDLPLVYRYSRADALRDGVLVDLTEWARDAGFILPVACTAAVWHHYLVPDPSIRGMGQSEQGRVHDLMLVLRAAVVANACGGMVADRMEFGVGLLMPPRQHVSVAFVAFCVPGDAGEPVITIMLPEED
jgi:hypothetical protein